jgi:hypothetical protein
MFMADANDCFQLPQSGFDGLGKSTSSVCLTQPKLSFNRWRLNVTAIIAKTARPVPTTKAAAELTRHRFRIAIMLNRIGLPVHDNGKRQSGR